MTTAQFCDPRTLALPELPPWLNAGLVVPNRTAAGREREFAPDQLERVRVLQALHRKEVGLSLGGISFTIALESYVQILEALINEYKIYHADDRHNDAIHLC